MISGLAFNNINVNVVTLAQITFPDALFWVNAVTFSCIETVKPQQQNSLAPSLASTKKYVLLMYNVDFK